MSRTQMATWFAPTPRSVDVGDADIVFGATHLLPEFLELAAAMPSCRTVTLVAPFLDNTLVEETSLFAADVAGRTNILVISTPSQALGPAAQLITKLPWRSCELRALHGLHSKLYMAVPEYGTPVALLGSHNFTAAGAGTNHEIGVLIHGRSSESRLVVAGLQQHVAQLRTRSRTVHDSLAAFPYAA